MKPIQFLFLILFFAQQSFAQLTTTPKEILAIPKLNFADSFKIWKQNSVVKLFESERADEYYIRRSRKFVEIGFNVTRIFKALNDQDANLDTVPGNYLVTLKLHKGLTALRFGTGFSLNNRIVPVPGQASNRNTTINSYSIRAGIEQQFRVLPRWTIIAGVDVFYANALRKTVVATSVDVVTTEKESIKFGLGPVLGVQWNAGKRISVGVETSGYYTFGKTYDRKKLQVDSNLDKTTITKEPRDWKIIAPNSIFLVFRF